MNCKCHTDWFTPNGTHESKNQRRSLDQSHKCIRREKRQCLHWHFRAGHLERQLNPCDKEKGALTRKKEMILVTVQSIA